MTTKQPRYYLPARYYLPVTLEQLQNLQSLLDVRAREPNPDAEVFQLLEGVRKTRVDAATSREKVQNDAAALGAEETNVSGRIKRAAKYVNELLSYGGIFPGQGPFGSTLEYRYHDGDLEDEIGQMRRLADGLNQLADALESDAE